MVTEEGYQSGGWKPWVGLWPQVSDGGYAPGMVNAHLKPRDSVPFAGEIAPEFTLQDQYRQDWRLADRLKQGEVVLCFFPLAFTGVCGTEMKCASDEMGRWKAKGMEVVGVSCDSFATLKAWAEKEGYHQTLLSDIHRQVCKAYGLYWPDLNVSWRGTVVIGRNGKVIWSQKRDIKQAMNLDEVLAHVG